MNDLTRTIKTLFREFTETDYDSIFHKATTLEKIPFESIFPSVPTIIIDNFYHPKQKNTEIINKFSRTIRFYPYKTPDYKKLVGEKTSVCILDNLTKSSDPLPENVPIVFISNSLFDIEKKRDIVIKRFGTTELHRVFIFHNTPLIQLIRGTLNCIPSANLIIMLLLSAYCSRIYIYGIPQISPFKHITPNTEVFENIYLNIEKSVIQFLLHKLFIFLISQNTKNTKQNTKNIIKNKPNPTPKTKPRYAVLNTGTRFILYKVKPKKKKSNKQKEGPRWLRRLKQGKKAYG